MTTIVNTMTVKKGCLQPVQIPNLEVQKFRRLTVSVSVTHSIQTFWLYTQKMSAHRLQLTVHYHQAHIQQDALPYT